MFSSRSPDVAQHGSEVRELFRTETAATRFTRRRWLASQALVVSSGMIARMTPSRARESTALLSRPSSANQVTRDHERLAASIDEANWQRLAQQAIDAARSAGATYADARLTRDVQYDMGVVPAAGDGPPNVKQYQELVGMSVRALVNGYWGFSATAVVTEDEAARSARDAVAQARENAEGPPWTVDLGRYPVAQGSWATPVEIDPFHVSFEEKQDFFHYWYRCAIESGLDYFLYGLPSFARFVRQEQVVATTDGALFTQTRYETGGAMIMIEGSRGGLFGLSDTTLTQNVQGIDMVGGGWEHFLRANIDEQFLSGQLLHALRARAAIPSKPIAIGRYTVVCDGATMANLVESTLGVTTQLDRALGYEANARGTSIITDPLGMVGHTTVAAPIVTLTANRSLPGELATVRWDDEGVVPAPFTLVKDGVLVDFQTTREQAAWLAPYYTAHGHPVASHGCAASENAHVTPIQQMPNLSLEPSQSAIRIDDMIADIPDGIFVGQGMVQETDSQARTGLLLGGTMRQIKNGRLGAVLTGGGILFEAPTLWQHITAIGGNATQVSVPCSSYRDDPLWLELRSRGAIGKGEPNQVTSHTIRAVAATLPNQPVIDPLRKG